MSEPVIAIGGIMLTAAIIMLCLAQAVRRMVVVIPVLFVAPCVALWWFGHVHGNGFRGGKETAIAVIVSAALLIGGLIGVGIGRFVRNWRERRGYLQD